MRQKITCFLPCRKGSERVPRKNIMPFAGRPKGLIQVKLFQLLSCQLIDEIVLTTNDEEIVEYANGLKQKRIIIHCREESLSSSDTSTDQLVSHALSLIPEGHILWTHVTSPFITGIHYSKIIRKYFEMLQAGYDSLMTTTPLRSFLWINGKPINYDSKFEKWPRTQTLTPVQEVNSGVFIASACIYKNENDRIGSAPYLYEMDKLISHDIDWPEDFLIAECLVEKKLLAL